MKLIGLLMINGEDDVLEATLAANTEYVDAFFCLDGTEPNDVSEDVCRSHPKCAGYLRDQDLPRPPYPAAARDGCRQILYEQAAGAFGYDNWFLLLHGDEVWTGLPDRLDHDGFKFNLPVYFPREGERWNYKRHPLEQLHWHLGPGWPEFRMFRGDRRVHYRPDQHFNVTPHGIKTIGECDKPIRHYLYRSPAAQRKRALQHSQTGFDPDNYRHIVEDDRVYWDDEMIGRWQTQACWRHLGNDTETPLDGHRSARAAHGAAA